MRINTDVETRSSVVKRLSALGLSEREEPVEVVLDEDHNHDSHEFGQVFVETKSVHEQVKKYR